MTQITRSFLLDVRTEIEDALAALGEKHGLKISVGGASFSDANATFKLELATIAADGNVLTKKANDFQRYAALHGLNPNDLGRVINYAGHSYKVVGLAPRASRFPVIVERQPDGKAFKLPVAALKNAI